MSVQEIVTWLRGLEGALENTLGMRITAEERAGLEPRRGLYSGIADDVAARWGKTSEQRPGVGARSTHPIVDQFAKPTTYPTAWTSAWPPVDVVKRLADFAEDRLTTHSYDGHGWEELQRCADEALAWLASPLAARAKVYDEIEGMRCDVCKAEPKVVRVYCSGHAPDVEKPSNMLMLSAAAVQLAHHRRCACVACEAAQETTHATAMNVDAVIKNAAPRIGEVPNQWRPLVGRWRPSSVTDIELVWYRAPDGGPAPPPERPTLTVEMCGKWYSLWLVYPFASAIEVPFHDLRLAMPDDVVYIDHVPKPSAVAALARYKGWDVCELAMEIIIGRWVDERHEYGDPTRAKLGLDTHVEG